jgi:uncharacterized protein YciI
VFLVLLKFSDNKGQASLHMEQHNAWIRRGFDEGVFVLVGSLKPHGGGGILAHRTTMEELRDRVNGDPFVTAGVVSAEIVEIAPSRVDERLGFLRGDAP